MGSRNRTYYFCTCLLMAIFCNLQGISYATGAKIQFRDLFSKPQFMGLNTAGKEFYLSDDEKYAIAIINLVRYNPKAFVVDVLLPAGHDTSSTEMRELMQTLKKHKSCMPLTPAFSLYKSANSHAKDMGASGKTGHLGSDGKSFHDRIQHFFAAQSTFFENYYTGSGDPLDVVIRMLLAKTETGISYRENILSSEIQYVGISIQPHRLKCTNAVVDFAKKPQLSSAQLVEKKKNMEVYWRDCPQGIKVSSRRKSGGFSFQNLFGGGK